MIARLRSERGTVLATTMILRWLETRPEGPTPSAP